MGDFFWVDRRARALAAELVLHESRSGAEKEIEVTEGGWAERGGHVSGCPSDELGVG